MVDFPVPGTPVAGDSDHITDHVAINTALSALETAVTDNEVGKSDSGHTHSYAADVHTHQSTYIADSTAEGRSVLTAASYASIRSLIGAGTSSFDGVYSSLTGKPTLGTASALDVPAAGDAAPGEVVKGTDSRLADARTPLTHTHPGGGVGGAEGTLVASSDNYPTIDPTGVADSAAGLRSAAGDVTEGWTFVIPPGTYRMDSDVIISSSMNVYAEGATFVQNSLDPCWSLRGSFGTTININSITPTIETGWGQSGEALWVTDLVMASTPTGWEVGDLIRIASNNRVLPSTSAYHAESATIIGVSGTTVTVAGTLRGTYSTSPRAAKWSDTRIRWQGGTFEASDSIMAGSSMADLGLLELEYLNGTQIEHPRFTRAQGPAIALSGCHDTRINEVVVDYARDNGGIYGYGINDQHSEGTHVHALFARLVRHAYTSNSSSASGASVGDSGRTVGAVVNGTCVAATQTAWDCHGDADEVHFDRCKSINSYGAFMMRGVDGRITDAFVRGKHPGGVVSAEIIASALIVYGVVVDGMLIDGVQLDGAGGANAALFNIKSDVAQTKPTFIRNVTIRNTTALYSVNSDRQKVQIDSIAYDSASCSLGTIREANGGTVDAMTVLVP